MGKTTITFRLDTEKKQLVDAIAELTDRDRSYVLKEAIDAYLDAHAWQIQHIRKGLKQAQAGQFTSAKEVAKALARWQR